MKKLLLAIFLFGLAAYILWDLTFKAPRIKPATVDKLEQVLNEEKLSEDQLHAFNSLSCQYLGASHLNGEEKRFAIANNLVNFANNLIASSQESHNGEATEVDKKEAQFFKELANKLIK